jgi:hypothetical protein
VFTKKLLVAAEKNTEKTALPEKKIKKNSTAQAVCLQWVAAV